MQNTEPESQTPQVCSSLNSTEPSCRAVRGLSAKCTMPQPPCPVGLPPCPLAVLTSHPGCTLWLPSPHIQCLVVQTVCSAVTPHSLFTVYLLPMQDTVLSSCSQDGRSLPSWSRRSELESKYLLVYTINHFAVIV